MFIQNKYCNGECFDQYIKDHKTKEDLLRGFLIQKASALSSLQKKGLAHMYIHMCSPYPYEQALSSADKPENIIFSIDKTREGSIDSDGGYSDGEKVEEEITFKLGKPW